MKHRYLVLTFVASFGAAMGAGYFMGANHQRNKTVVRNITEVAPKTNAADHSTPADVDSSPISSTTIDNNSPLNSEATSDATYIIKKGDTLYSIGLQYKIDWPALAKFNDLTDQSVLKEGQVLKIPSETEAKTAQAREYVVPENAEEKTSLQTAQDYATNGTGQLAYRLVPAQVVQQSLLLSRFSFSNDDLFIEKSKDYSKGDAVVEVTHAAKLYNVYLSQPLTKGEKGVWTPTKVLY